MKTSYSILFLLISLSFLAASSWRPLNALPIYGMDDRKEVREIEDPGILQRSRSVALLVKNDSLRPARGRDHFQYNPSNMSQYGMCGNEKYSQQPSLGFCTGFLVGPDLLATAGHCIENADDCSKTIFVFDFSIKKGNSPPALIPASNVYSCAGVVHSVNAPVLPDWALIRLDRPAQDRPALELNLSGEINKDTPVYVIGHPYGLPMKMAAGAKVAHLVTTGLEGVGFSANIDAMNGNSGSPVFNAKTGKVEGIAVNTPEGSTKDHNGCKETLRLPSRGGIGLIINKISLLAPHLPPK